MKKYIKEYALTKKERIALYIKKNMRRPKKIISPVLYLSHFPALKTENVPYVWAPSLSLPAKAIKATRREIYKNKEGTSLDKIDVPYSNIKKI
jgi:hypothetical protein